MEIKIYITPTCPWCKKLKEWLKKKKLAFVEFDIIESDKHRDEVLDKTGRMAVPVIDIDGTIISGFDEKALEQAISKANGK